MPAIDTVPKRKMSAATRRKISRALKGKKRKRAEIVSIAFDSVRKEIDAASAILDALHGLGQASRRNVLGMVFGHGRQVS